MFKRINEYIKPFKKGEILIVTIGNYDNKPRLARVIDKIDKCGANFTLPVKIYSSNYSISTNLNEDVKILVRSYNKDINKVKKENSEYFV